MSGDQSTGTAEGNWLAKSSETWATSTGDSGPGAAIISETFVGHVTHTPPCWKGLAKKPHSESTKQRAALMGISASPNASNTALICQANPATSFVWSCPFT